MPEHPLRFDPFLPNVRSDELKSMVRMWGGGSQTRKDDCIAIIRQGLADPAKARAAVATLAPWEANALALVKAAGGALDGGALCVAMRASGANLPGGRLARADDRIALLMPLIKRGLVLTEYSGNPAYISDYGSNNVFTDERLLAAAGPLMVMPFALKPIASPPDGTLSRRPQAVALDLIGLLQAVENQGGIGLTQNGPPRVNDLRKIGKAMSWSEEATLVDGLPFPNLTAGLIHALRHAGVLKDQGGLLTLAAPVSAFAALPYAEQAGLLFNGFAQASEWDERGTQIGYFDLARLVQARNALVIALTALPTQGAGFFAVDDLDRALFERIGEHFSLAYLRPQPYGYGKTPEQVRQELLAWQTQMRQDWLSRERPWLDRALTTWCYYLGLVELSLKDKAPHALRLTDLGRAILHADQAPAEPVLAVTDRVAWVVQPNFEIVVYLDRATPEQLAFLERHAERFQTQQHIAQYRLTRPAIYAALESGSKLDRLLATLEGGAGRPLPQNIIAEIREWAVLREQVTLYRRARLLEYTDTLGRDADVKRLSGMAIGDRFLLVNANQAAQAHARQRVDYAAALAKCLVAGEDGMLITTQPLPDLLLDAQIGRWAARRGAQWWQLTQDSVAAGVKAGLALAELLKLLADRLIHPVPRLLDVALHAWAGERSAINLTSITVLQCAQPAIFDAIVGSAKLRPFLRGELAPDLVVVDQSQLEALREQLRWAGLEVSAELTVKQRQR
jgi:hypothetical protein